MIKLLNSLEGEWAGCVYWHRNICAFHMPFVCVCNIYECLFMHWISLKDVKLPGGNSGWSTGVERSLILHYILFSSTFKNKDIKSFLKVPWLLWGGSDGKHIYGPHLLVCPCMPMALLVCLCLLIVAIIYWVLCARLLEYLFYFSKKFSIVWSMKLPFLKVKKWLNVHNFVWFNLILLPHLLNINALNFKMELRPRQVKQKV